MGLLAVSLTAGAEVAGNAETQLFGRAVIVALRFGIVAVAAFNMPWYACAGIGLNSVTPLT